MWLVLVEEFIDMFNWLRLDVKAALRVLRTTNFQHFILLYEYPNAPDYRNVNKGNSIDREVIRVLPGVFHMNKNQLVLF